MMMTAGVKPLESKQCEALRRLHPLRYRCDALFKRSQTIPSRNPAFFFLRERKGRKGWRRQFKKRKKRAMIASKETKDGDDNEPSLLPVLHPLNLNQIRRVPSSLLFLLESRKWFVLMNFVRCFKVASIKPILFLIIPRIYLLKLILFSDLRNYYTYRTKIPLMGRVIKFRGRIMNKFNSAGGGDQMQIRLIPGAIEQFRENSREGGRDIYTSIDLLPRDSSSAVIAFTVRPESAGSGGKYLKRPVIRHQLNSALKLPVPRRKSQPCERTSIHPVWRGCGARAAKWSTLLMLLRPFKGSYTRREVNIRSGE